MGKKITLIVKEDGSLLSVLLKRDIDEKQLAAIKLLLDKKVPQK